MPINEMHSDYTFQMYGVKASDLHRWMDEPWEIHGKSHRQTRHNANFIPKKFIDKYGKELAQVIMEDHILLDNREYVSDNSDGRVFSEKRTVSIDDDFLIPPQKYSVKKVRREFPNAYKKWTKSEEFKLIKGYDE